VYALLFFLWIYTLTKEIGRGPELAPAVPVVAAPVVAAPVVAAAPKTGRAKGGR
jgi:hypothetical protein